MFIPIYSKTNNYPSKSSTGAAGLDIKYLTTAKIKRVTIEGDSYNTEETDESFTLYPNERCLIGTGLHIVLPKGYRVDIKGRSGLAWNHGIVISHGVGTGDEDYLGEYKIMLTNTSVVPYQINKNDKLAQIMIEKVNEIQWQPISIDELNNIKTERNDNGFGSTGR